MGPVAGRALGVGPVSMAGRAPNGQAFVANPQRIWFVAGCTTSLAGEDLGPIGSLAEPAALGDFVIPQRGVFTLGRAFFE